MSDDHLMEMPPDPDDGLAAEYVLGTLSVDEAAQARHRVASDPGFARAVDAWQQRLAPLLDAIPEASPPEGVFYDVRQAIGAASYDARPDPQFSQEAQNIIRFDKAEAAMRRWRRIAVLSGAVAASLVAFVIFREVYSPQTGRETFVAVLESDTREPAFVAAIDIDAGTVSIRRVGAVPTSGKSHELWAIGAGRTAPQSLGVVQADLTLPASQLGAIDPAELRETVFAISLEPAGGSTTGQPTGPVVFTGKLLPAPDAPAPGLLDRIRKIWPKN